MQTFEKTPEFAEREDTNDSLGSFRERFFIPQKNGKELIYFCGNSLGLQPKSVKNYIDQELESWAGLAVEGHFSGKNPWMHYHKFLQPLIAEVVGAKETEVVVANSLTVNLHLLLTTFYQPEGKKYKILVENNPFSSDWYALESLLKIKGLNPEDSIIELKPETDNLYISTNQFKQTLEKHSEEIALVLLGGVNYLTGQAFEMKEIISKAHEFNIPVGLDLAHAAGNLELKLHEWKTDFAVWCSYKYLNSGPGGTGGYFIHENHAANTSLPRLAGWWGQKEENRFKMEKAFTPTPTAEGWQLSNAPVISMAAQWASLDIFKEAGIKRLREKSIKLTGYLEFLLREEILNRTNPFSIEIITPQNPDERGCQLSLKIGKNGQELFNKIQNGGYIVDFRNPDIIRVSPAPLYNKFSEVYQFVNYLKQL